MMSAPTMMPLQDCTKATLQETNVQHKAPNSVAAAKKHLQQVMQRSKSMDDASIATPARRTHNPYASVIPSNPQEAMFHVQMHQYAVAMQAMEQRMASRSQGSSPLMPHTNASFGSTPASPMMFTANTHTYGETGTANSFSGFIEEPQVPTLKTPAKKQSAPAPTTVDVAPSTPKSPSRRDSQLPATSLTKVYQNGRPVPTLKPSSPTDAAPCTTAPATFEPTLEGRCVVTVQFRQRAHTGKFIVENCLEILKTNTRSTVVGIYVIVDGDRGVDLGRIIAVEEQSASPATKKSRKDDVDTHVQRLATQEEVNSYESAQLAEEHRALTFASTQAGKLLTQKLTIEQVTFQYDRQKLTLWYRSTERVYFVPLLKVLNQQYKCRIWMEKLEDNENNQE